MEKYKTLKKETDEDTNKGKHILCSWMGRINIIKMSIITKAIYRFNEIPIKILMAYFHKTITSNPKIYIEPLKPLNSQNNLEKKQSCRYQAPGIKLYYKAIVIKTVW